MIALGMSCLWNFGKAYTSWCAFHKNQSFFKESTLCAIARSSHVYVFHKSFFLWDCVNKLKLSIVLKKNLSQNQIGFHETIVNEDNFMFIYLFLKIEIFILICKKNILSLTFFPFVSAHFNNARVLLTFSSSWTPWLFWRAVKFWC